MTLSIKNAKNVVIFIQTILSFVLSRKIINIYNDIARKYGNVRKLFRKKNNKPIYINKHPNHPPSTSNNCQNQFKNEYPKHRPIRVFLMNQ